MSQVDVRTHLLSARIECANEDDRRQLTAAQGVLSSRQGLQERRSGEGTRVVLTVQRRQRMSGGRYRMSQ